MGGVGGGWGISYWVHIGGKGFQISEIHRSQGNTTTSLVNGFILGCRNALLQTHGSVKRAVSVRSNDEVRHTNHKNPGVGMAVSTK